MADLKGKVFAFTDPISLAGRVYPTSLVESLGSAPDAFFSRTFFTYSHDEAIYAVANGLADGASVDSLVYDYAIIRDPALTQKVKVIHRSPAFGIPPVKTHSVSALVERRGDQVIAIVEDDGQGFAPSQSPGEHHLGLAGMRERAELLGRRLTIESEPGKGTSVHVQIPLTGVSPSTTDSK